MTHAAAYSPDIVIVVDGNVIQVPTCGPSLELVESVIGLLEARPSMRHEAIGPVMKALVAVARDAC